MNNKNSTKAEKMVVSNLHRLQQRTTTRIVVSGICGVLLGSGIGCVLTFGLDLSEKWIGLGFIGLCLGLLIGVFGGIFVPSDFKAIEEELSSLRKSQLEQCNSGESGVPPNGGPATQPGN